MISFYESFFFVNYITFFLRNLIFFIFRFVAERSIQTTADLAAFQFSNITILRHFIFFSFCKATEGVSISDLDCDEGGGSGKEIE